MAQYGFELLPKAEVLLTALKTFNDKRYLNIFLFGISSGFPWIMIGSVLSAWLKDEGLSRSAIGLFGIIFATYSFNFLWSPLVDKVRPPILGQRKGWIFAMQCCIVSNFFQLCTKPQRPHKIHISTAICSSYEY